MTRRAHKPWDQLVPNWSMVNWFAASLQEIAASIAWQQHFIWSPLRQLCSHPVVSSLLWIQPHTILVIKKRESDSVLLNRSVCPQKTVLVLTFKHSAEALIQQPVEHPLHICWRRISGAMVYTSLCHFAICHVDWLQNQGLYLNTQANQFHGISLSWRRDCQSPCTWKEKREYSYKIVN